MSVFAGFDTSNYTTSAAVYNDSTGEMRSVKRLLDVPEGELGLRQSDALFSHVQRLPEITAGLGLPAGEVTAVCASTRPRAVEGSYMPCFHAGETVGRVLASFLDVPFYACSHQQGHLAAAAWSAGRLDLLEREFYAFHLSGGTTELLYVRPGKDGLPDCECVGGSADISAGQAIDRCGVMLGLGFPAGAALDRLAGEGKPSGSFLSRQRGLHFSLSGLENKFREQYAAGERPEEIARFVIDSVVRAVFTCIEEAEQLHPGLPLLLMGGVASNRRLRAEAVRRFSAVIAPPEYSSDNAAGTALLAARLWRRETGAAKEGSRP